MSEQKKYWSCSIGDASSLNWVAVTEEGRDVMAQHGDEFGFTTGKSMERHLHGRALIVGFLGHTFDDQYRIIKILQEAGFESGGTAHII